VLLGNLADFDYLNGILIGDPGHLHHGFTQSILFSLILTISVLSHLSRNFQDAEGAIMGLFEVTLSHLFMDALTLDTAAPYGIPLLWPFSGAFFRSPFSVFLNVNSGMSLHVLLTWHNFLAIGLEIVVTLLLLPWILLKRDMREACASISSG